MTPDVTVSQAIVDELRKVDAACVGDVVRGLRLSGIPEGVKPLSRDMTICGPAATMRHIASRNKLSRKTSSRSLRRASRFRARSHLKARARNPHEPLPEHRTIANRDATVFLFPLLPGGIVIGNAGGVVIVRAERAEEIQKLARERHEGELKMHNLVESRKKKHGDPEVDSQVQVSWRLEGVKQADGYRW